MFGLRTYRGNYEPIYSRLYIDAILKIKKPSIREGLFIKIVVVTAYLPNAQNIPAWITLFLKSGSMLPTPLKSPTLDRPAR